jgi:WD40 repeat protein
VIQRGQRAVSVLCVDSLAYSPDGRTLGVGEYDGHIYLWDVSCLAMISQHGLPPPRRSLRRMAPSSAISAAEGGPRGT